MAKKNAKQRFTNTHALTRQTRFRWRKPKPTPKPKPLLRDRTWQSTFDVDNIDGIVQVFLRYRLAATGLTK